MKVPKISYLDDLTKKELVYRELVKHEFGVTASMIATKFGLAWRHAKKILNYFNSLGLVKKHKVGKVVLYKAKDLNKYLNIRKYLESLEDGKAKNQANQKVSK